MREEERERKKGRRRDIEREGERGIKREREGETGIERDSEVKSAQSKPNPSPNAFPKICLYARVLKREGGAHGPSLREKNPREIS